MACLPIDEQEGILFHPHDDIMSFQPPQVDVGISERLSVIGYPFGAAAQFGLPVWVQGFVATPVGLDYDNQPCFLIDARTREGQSGSPVVYFSTSGMFPSGGGMVSGATQHTSQFMGIYSGRINEKSDLGRVWPLRAVRAVLLGHQRAMAL